MVIGDKVKIRVELKDRKGRSLPSTLNGIIVDETNLEYKVKTTHGVFSLLKDDVILKDKKIEEIKNDQTE